MDCSLWCIGLMSGNANPLLTLLLLSPPPKKSLLEVHTHLTVTRIMHMSASLRSSCISLGMQSYVLLRLQASHTYRKGAQPAAHP
jgi:hypothetical protein